MEYTFEMLEKTFGTLESCCSDYVKIKVEEPYISEDSDKPCFPIAFEFQGRDRFVVVDFDGDPVKFLEDLSQYSLSNPNNPSWSEVARVFNSKTYLEAFCQPLGISSEAIDWMYENNDASYLDEKLGITRDCLSCNKLQNVFETLKQYGYFDDYKFEFSKHPAEGIFPEYLVVDISNQAEDRFIVGLPFIDYSSFRADLDNSKDLIPSDKRTPEVEKLFDELIKAFNDPHCEQFLKEELDNKTFENLWSKMQRTDITLEKVKKAFEIIQNHCPDEAEIVVSEPNPVILQFVHEPCYQVTFFINGEQRLYADFKVNHPEEFLAKLNEDDRFSPEPLEVEPCEVVGEDLKELFGPEFFAGINHDNRVFSEISKVFNSEIYDLAFKEALGYSLDDKIASVEGQSNEKSKPSKKHNRDER